MTLFLLYQQNFLVQIKCENQVFPLNLSKNEVRRRICQNEPSSASRLSSCYQREGLVIQDDEESSLEDEKHLQNFVSLIVSNLISLLLNNEAGTLKKLLFFCFLPDDRLV